MKYMVILKRYSLQIIGVLSLVALGAFIIQSKTTIAKFGKIALTSYGSSGYGATPCSSFGYGSTEFGYSAICNNTGRSPVTWRKSPVIVLGKDHGDATEIQPFSSYSGDLSLSQSRLGENLPQIIAAVQQDQSRLVTTVKLYDVRGYEFQSFAPFGSKYRLGARVLLLDTTGDGIKDLIVAPRSGKTAVVYRLNQGEGVFEKLQTIQVSPTGISGDIDLKIAKLSSTSSYLATVLQIGSNSMLRVWKYNRSSGKLVADTALTVKFKLLNNQVILR